MKKYSVFRITDITKKDAIWRVSDLTDKAAFMHVIRFFEFFGVKKSNLRSEIETISGKSMRVNERRLFFTGVLTCDLGEPRQRPFD